MRLLVDLSTFTMLVGKLPKNIDKFEAIVKENNLEDRVIFTVVRNTIVKLVGLLLILIFVKKQTDVYLYAIIQTVTVLLGNLSLWLYLPEFISFKYFKKERISHGQVGMFTLTLLLIISGIAVYFSILSFTKDDILSDIRKSFNGRFRRL